MIIAKRLRHVACPKCGKEAHHCIIRRRLHRIECPPCGRRTEDLASLEEALKAWGVEERVVPIKRVAK